MKKITTITLAIALTLLVSGFAYAMQEMTPGTMNHGDMTHGEMKAGDMNVGESMKAMEDNLAMMKMDVEKMKDPAQRKAAMDDMNKHMTDMHNGMAAVEANAKMTKDAMTEKSMKSMNKDMMTTMKGMGVMKKDADKGMEMMMEGINNMEKTMSMMKGMK